MYRKWLKHAEILEYFGSSEENQTFLSSARNVTPDDEVFLRVRRSHPLLYTYTVTIDEADTPEEPLLTIAGSPITTFNPFEIQKAAEVAKAKAEEAGSVSPEPTIDPKSGKTSDPDEMVRFLTGRTARKSSDEWNVRERLIASAQPDFTGSYTQLNRARDRQATYFGAVVDLKPRVSTLATDVQILADDVVALEQHDCFSTSKTCMTTEIQRVLGERQSPKTLAEVLTQHDKLALDIATLSVPPAELERALEETERALQRAKEILLRAGIAVADVEKLPDVPVITQGILDVRGKTREMVAQLKELQTALSTLRTRLQGLQVALGAAMSRTSNADVCLLLGRFAAQKTIRVTVALTKRPEPQPAPEPSAARIAELARNLLAEVEKGSKTPTRVSAKPTEAREKTSEQGEEEAATEKPKPSRLTSTEFAVLRPIHVQTTLGYGISFLAAPSFDFRSRSIAEVKAVDGTIVTPATKEITPFALDQNERQLLPMVQFGLHIRTRYPFAGPDDSPNESIKPWDRWVPFPTVGFGLSSPTENYFVGGGVNLSRGVLAVAGLHFGKVKRLVAGRAEETSFTIRAADDFAIEDIVDEGIRPHFFFALTIDSSTIGKLFSAAGTSDNADSGAKKKKP